MNKIQYVVFLFTLVVLNLISPTSTSAQSNEIIMDFETYEGTPYFFRYGNYGNQSFSTYKPRWVYSHSVVDNPYVDPNNSSSKVLQYTSMEARNFGVKFKFETSIKLNDLKTISFKVYQPNNVIGKSIDTDYNSSQSPTTKQEIAVKLLSDYNSVCDFRSEDGITLESQNFTIEGAWITFNYSFSTAGLSQTDTNKFIEGIKGIAVLPTYDSNVTLNESNIYICYIDDIAINEEHSGISNIDTNKDINIFYRNGLLHVAGFNNAIQYINIYDLSGLLIKRLDISNSTSIGDGYSFELSLSSKAYVVEVISSGSSLRKTIVAIN